MDICSNDHELDLAFSRAFGPSHETLLETFRRAIHNVSASVVNPKPLSYELDDLTRRLREVETAYTVEETSVLSHTTGIVFNCVVWRYPLPLGQRLSSPKPCFIYIHSDSRCLIDSADILPVAERFGADVIGYDIPGTGKSKGTFDLRPSVQAELLHAIVQWAIGTIRPTNIILWSRGLSTAFAVEYLRTRQSLITAAVFDSPFASTRGIVDAGLRAFRGRNFSYIPSIMFRPLVWAVRQDLKSVLRMDPFLIRPYEVASLIFTPCVCLSALHDDVIPHEQGEAFHDRLRGPRSYTTFHGGHIGSRPREVVLLAEEHLKACISTLR